MRMLDVLTWVWLAFAAVALIVVGDAFPFLIVAAVYSAASIVVREITKGQVAQMVARLENLDVAKDSLFAQVEKVRDSARRG